MSFCRGCVLVVFGVALLSGCATTERRVTAYGSDPVAEVLSHRDARKVAHDYPDFFSAALGKIAALKHDLTLEENK